MAIWSAVSAIVNWLLPPDMAAFFLLDSPEDPLAVSEMIVLYDDTMIRIWWGQCPLTEPMDLLFRRHHQSKSEPGTPAPFAHGYGGRDNRDNPSRNTVASEEPEDHLESDRANGSNGGRPESSATAAKRGAPQKPETPHTLRTHGRAHTSRTAKSSSRALQGPRDSQPESSATAARRAAPRVPRTPRTRRSYGMTQTSRTAKASTQTPRRMRNRAGLHGANDTEPDDSESDFAEIVLRNMSVGLEPDSQVISDIALGKQRSAPLPEARVLRSGRQIPGLVSHQPDRKKAPTSTPINSSSKSDWITMTGGADPERAADIHQPQRKRVRRNATPPTGPITESDAVSQPTEVQEALSNASSAISHSPQASGPPAMSAEDLVMELREAAERVQTEPSRDQAAAPPQSSSTSPPPVSPEDLTMELRRSADLLLRLAASALTEETNGLGDW